MDLPNPPIYSKTNPADAPILTLALTSKTLPLSKVEDLADTRFAQKISQLSGVGLVSISGGQKPAVRIQANPTVLSSYGITLEDVRDRHRSVECQPSQGQLRRCPTRPIRLPQMTSFYRATSTGRWSSPIATAHRSIFPMSPRSSTTWKTSNRRHG